LTVGGNSVIRDTAHISEEVKRFFSFIEYASQTLTIARLGMTIKITAHPEGAIFDVTKNGKIATMNFCCFEESNKEIILSLVQQAADLYKIQATEPVTPTFLYSAVINPFALSPSEMKIAGEVELYIYYQLLLSKNK
jgi:hypothetical protein